MKQVLFAAGAALLMFGSLAAAQGQEMSCCQTKPAPKAKPQAATPAGGVQKVTVMVDGGYTPASVSVKAGKPVEITFVRKSAAGCDGEIVFPTLGIKRTLKPGEKTVVKFTPKKSETLTYTCGMGMYKGNVVVK